MSHRQRFGFFFSALFIVLLLSCGKSHMKWMYYDETKCADKWDPALNNEVLKDNVTSYLRSKGIKVYDIEIFNMGTPESCSECACKTGRQFKVKVKRSDKRDIQAEGFHE